MSDSEKKRAKADKAKANKKNKQFGKLRLAMKRESN
jgi:hypothetical protein